MRQFFIAFTILLFAFAHCRDEKTGVRAFQSATVRVKKLSLRIDPVPLASEIEILNAGDKLELLKRSERKTRSGSSDDYWYYVRSPSGQQGWIYGGGLSVALAGGGEEQEQKYTAKQIQENLVGKWWELLPDGSTGLKKIYFWPAGKYKYGLGIEEPKEGKYEIRAEDKIIRLKSGSPAGDKVEVRFVGQEMRLSGQCDGKACLFRRGELNPEAREVLDEKKDSDKAPKKDEPAPKPR